MECRPSVPTWQSNTSDFKCKRQIKRRYEQRFYDVSGRSPWYRWSRAVDIVDIFLNASTGTASAWRRPPALLGRRPDATTGRLGPVAAHAVRLVPSAASVRACQVSALLALLLR